MILSDMRIIAGPTPTVHPSSPTDPPLGYLRAVLSQTIFHCPALYSFLEIPVALLHNVTSSSAPDNMGPSDHHRDMEAKGGSIGIPGSPPEVPQHLPAATELSRNRSTAPNESQAMSDHSKDQWRKVYLHLRKNLKPHEIAVSSPPTSPPLA
jgi:hypothetical protein